jgi:hypothetical protein
MKTKIYLSILKEHNRESCTFLNLHGYSACISRYIQNDLGLTLYIRDIKQFFFHKNNDNDVKNV